MRGRGQVLGDALVLRDGRLLELLRGVNVGEAAAGEGRRLLQAQISGAHTRDVVVACGNRSTHC